MFFSLPINSAIVLFLGKISQGGSTDMLLEGLYKIRATVKAAFKARLGDVASAIKQALCVAYLTKLNIFFYSDVGIALEYGRQIR